MMQTIAMLIELILPGTRIVNGLDQFDIQLPHVKESKLGARNSGLTIVFGLRFVHRVGNDDIGHGQAENFGPGARFYFNIAHNDSDLSNYVISECRLCHLTSPHIFLRPKSIPTSFRIPLWGWFEETAVFRNEMFFYCIFIQREAKTGRVGNSDISVLNNGL